MAALTLSELAEIACAHGVYPAEITLRSICMAEEVVELAASGKHIYYVCSDTSEIAEIMFANARDRKLVCEWRGDVLRIGEGSVTMIEAP